MVEADERHVRLDGRRRPAPYAAAATAARLVVTTSIQMVGAVNIAVSTEASPRRPVTKSTVVPDRAAPTCNPPKWRTFANDHRSFNAHLMGARTARPRRRLMTCCRRQNNGQREVRLGKVAIAFDEMSGPAHQFPHIAS